ncbi:hypothetical protein HRR80_008243 [Exophiala dermatitidis]|uniref:Dienelactone hydrolase domain-containing protein n=1 Tax=Exophiala dermatitidis TaxID=5970 RepID=A0AAN6EN11_EXODE|nr:hypothetical protein HRR76_001548 [Exophiala dermatitidis]KAJ4625947.1 hypothetical protein HRR86_004374 [Exophiala dermatitidis]KAJ4690130.1 hypothetical protein HRR87_008776 [Exophiala dermatitidis]KAJ8987609.1 hypothetical protein HRR80_008243 [Exophiala dermatitidis]KAJ8996791.1 hypothetical protein HRR94_008185 [Exophiala dermatitidis]
MTARRLSALAQQLSSSSKSVLQPLSQTRTLASMSQSQTPSAACCNTPAVVSKGYKEKGSYTTVDGLKTYTTGPSSAKKGILVVYDIFGFFPQTIQGVDILAYADKDHPYQIFMPDFFEGEPADISWYPPDTEEKGKKLGEFFQTKAAPPKTVERVKKVMEELKSKHPHLKEWGVMGYCWGGKVSVVSWNDYNERLQLTTAIFRLSTWFLRPERRSRQPPHATRPWLTRTTLPMLRSPCS